MRTQTVFGVAIARRRGCDRRAPGADKTRRANRSSAAPQVAERDAAPLDCRRTGVHRECLEMPPANNRDPTEEVAQCEPFLRRQVELIQRRSFWPSGASRTKPAEDRYNHWSFTRRRFSYGDIPLVVTYHPAICCVLRLKNQGMDDLGLLAPCWRSLPLRIKAKPLNECIAANHHPLLRRCMTRMSALMTSSVALSISVDRWHFHDCIHVDIAAGVRARRLVVVRRDVDRSAEAHILNLCVTRSSNGAASARACWSCDRVAQSTPANSMFLEVRPPIKAPSAVSSMAFNEVGTAKTIHRHAGARKRADPRTQIEKLMTSVLLARYFSHGATATERPNLAMQLAAQFPLEIVSVDSALVYRGMDIGTRSHRRNSRTCPAFISSIL